MVYLPLVFAFVCVCVCVCVRVCVCLFICLGGMMGRYRIYVVFVIGQVACGGCNTMAVVEHDASLVLRDYEGVRKELDELTRKHPAPPAGLLVGSSAGFPRSPSEGGAWPCVCIQLCF
jgi:hypothetical protein